MNDNELIDFSYCNEEGETTEECNHNGSLYNIAGITNKEKNVLGMMPHPERAVFENLGNTDGRLIFESLIER